ILANGECALVFPEGTYAYSPDPAAMLPFKTGAAWLALRAGVPVVPVGIWGTERVWHPSRGWRPWQRPRVEVVFGEPYIPTPPPDLPTKAALVAIAEDMARRVAALIPPAYRGHYADDGRATLARREPAPQDPTRESAPVAERPSAAS